jgi:hypothetical protein
MTPPTATISHVIDTLARQTSAPEEFVLRTREMFVRRGISLDAPSGQYFDSLVDTFEREERIRLNAERAQERLRELDGQLDACEHGCKKLIEDLERVQENLRRQARRLGLD